MALASFLNSFLLSKLISDVTYATAKTSFENGTGVAWANDNTEVIAYSLENEGYVVGHLSHHSEASPWALK